MISILMKLQAREVLYLIELRLGILKLIGKKDEEGTVGEQGELHVSTARPVLCQESKHVRVCNGAN